VKPLIDRLNPRYLARVIRIDPWRQPYEYEGTGTSFVLRSAGPDEKANTADDVTISVGR
jgi:type II secretion system (T2SS) protein G